MATIIRKSIKVQISAQSDNVNTGFLRKYSFFSFFLFFIYFGQILPQVYLHK